MYKYSFRFRLWKMPFLLGVSFNGQSQSAVFCSSSAAPFGRGVASQVSDAQFLVEGRTVSAR